MKDKNKEDILRRIMGNNNKQSEIKNLDAEQRNYNPNIVDIDEFGIQVDFTDFVNTLNNLEDLVKNKSDKSSQNQRSSEILAFSELMKKTTAYIIQKKRNEAKLTQQQVADTGFIARNYLSDIENGKTEISLTTLFLISKALNLNPTTFVNEINQKINNPNDKQSQATFNKNIQVQVGFAKFIWMSVYDTDKGKKLIIPDEDFTYYKNKYGVSVYFYMDRKEENVMLATPTEKTGIKYKIVETNNLLDNAINLK